MDSKPHLAGVFLLSLFFFSSFIEANCHVRDAGVRGPYTQFTEKLWCEVKGTQSKEENESHSSTEWAFQQLG